MATTILLRFRPGARESAKAGAQSQLALSRRCRAPALGTSVWRRAMIATHLGGVLIGPRRLDQCAPGRAIAGFGDGALMAMLTGGIFTGDQAEIAHQLARMAKARQIAQLGHDAHGMNELNAAASLQRGDHRAASASAPAPVRWIGVSRCTRAVASSTACTYSSKAMRCAGLRQRQARNPAPMRLGPRRLAGVTNVVTQQQRRQPMARLALHGHRVLARAHQIAHRLIAPDRARRSA